MGTKALFSYNWQVRADWLAWCADLPDDALLTAHTGGLGGILRTLYHIVQCEYSWIRVIQGGPAFSEPFAAHASLGAVRELSGRVHPYVAAYVDTLTPAELERRFVPPWNRDQTLRVRAVLDHVIVHEVHHTGQLSVWAREIGRTPVSAEWLGREGAD